MKILIINGPNLNQIGKREEAFYGIEDFEKIFGELQEKYPEMDLEYFQSNTEGAIIDKLHEAEDLDFKGVVINAAAYSHYSIAIRDALSMMNIPRIEVHFSNIYAREPFRNVSVISAVCQGTITGFGKHSYFLALEWFRVNALKRIGFK